MPRPAKNLIEKRFGRLLIKSRASSTNTKRKSPTWNALCDCGESKIVSTSSLRAGANSCGCLVKEHTIKQAIVNIKPNNQSARNNILRRYKTFAKYRSLEFTLSKEEFNKIIVENCYYCGAIPAQCVGINKLDTFKYNGIDRINNNHGYSSDNCVPCCGTCNKAKNNQSLDKFYEWLERTYIKMKDRTIYEKH